TGTDRRCGRRRRSHGSRGTRCEALVPFARHHACRAVATSGNRPFDRRGFVSPRRRRNVWGTPRRSDATGAERTRPPVAISFVAEPPQLLELSFDRPLEPGDVA